MSISTLNKNYAVIPKVPFCLLLKLKIIIYYVEINYANIVHLPSENKGYI